MAKAKIEFGTILTVGKKDDAFRMVAEATTETHVSGTLMGDENLRAAWCTVPISEITKREAPTTGSLNLAKRAKQFRIESSKVTAADLPKTEPKAEKPKREAPKRKASGGETQLDRAVVIAKANPTASRKDLIDMLVKQLGMTPAGASTYASNARKIANQQ